MLDVLLIIVLSAFASVLAVGAIAFLMLIVDVALHLRDARRKRSNVRAVEDATGRRVK